MLSLTEDGRLVQHPLPKLEKVHQLLVITTLNIWPQVHSTLLPMVDGKQALPLPLKSKEMETQTLVITTKSI
jgi:hypothetical protein